MIRLLHSAALLSLTAISLSSCAGPKVASTQGKPRAAVNAPPFAAMDAPSGTAGAPTATTSAPVSVDAVSTSAKPPPAAPGAPQPDPGAEARASYWNLAMQRYKPPASGALPAENAPAQTETTTAAAPSSGAATTPPASLPAKNAAHAPDLNPADIPYATWAPGKRGVVKSPFDPSGRLIDVRDFNAGQLSQCPYTGKIFRVPPLK